MKVLINTAIIRFGGAVQVALSLVNEFRHFPDNEYHIFVGKGLKESLNRSEFSSNFYFYDFDFGPITILKILHIQQELSKYEKLILPDCVITTSGPSYWKTISPHLMGYNLPLYIYPESPFFNTISLYRRLRFYIKRLLQLHFIERDADVYFVQTDDVNHRVRKLFKTDQVYTISNTHSNFFINPKQSPAKLPSKQKEQVRLITLTSYYPHKNLEIIPEIIKELKKRGRADFQFILTVSSEQYNKLFGDQYIEDAITVNGIRNEECPSLYSECDLMFLPSLAECFSASFPEAMIMQKPIVTTDLSFAQNICGDAALYYEAMNPCSAADAIEKLIENPDMQEELINNGLKRLTYFNNPKERAQNILTICQNVLIGQEDA